MSEATPDEFRMSLFEHLAELRTRLLRCTIAVLVLGLVGLIFARELYGVLMRPVLMALPPDASSLVFTSAIEEINVFMKVGLYSGVFFATPVVLWQIWGFVSPGLYEREKKLASPFVLSGSLAFVGGALFAYFVVLPSMFQFLLREEGAAENELRLNVGRQRAEDVLRLMSLGQFDGSLVAARAAVAAVESGGEARANTDGDYGVSLVPKKLTEATVRLDGLGRLIDAVARGAGGGGGPVVLQAVGLRQEAVELLAKDKLSEVAAKCDEAVRVLSGSVPQHTGAVTVAWDLLRDIAAGQALYESKNWTRPMLSMTEQLTLVLVLELAFGVIFELPIVMALLALVGLVKSGFLFKYQRHAIVVCLILAAVITPTGDAVNLALMAGPMIACYEIGVLLVWLIERRRTDTPAASPP